ncbi:ACT domain-containing protein [Propionivibrio sp.]|uniref:ACT domain-containing protein n=1 Tax=Propionivibrio sp. TaxID=2212460 RepID=UPI00260FA457|nr:ACT domain-containing protein [Propionivibrio sp.]
MIIKQISIFMENTTGRLADVTDLLAKAGINLRALSIADTTDFGILRMVADQPDAAVQVLKASGFTARETEVIGVEVPDHPGELARIMALFRDEGVNIEYLYASLEHSADKAVIVLKVDDVNAGLAMLEKHGFSTIPSF